MAECFFRSCFRLCRDCGVFPALAAGPLDWAGDQWTAFSGWVFDMQRQYHRELVALVRAVKSEGSMAAAWALIVGSFIYGVFHAAGPGHGKAILSAYLLTHESHIRRGVWIALASALVQGVTAVVLVEGARELIGWSTRDAYAASGTLESISFGLIAALGAMLAWRGTRAFLRSRKTGQAVAVHDHAQGAPLGAGRPSRSPRPMITTTTIVGMFISRRRIRSRCRTGGRLPA